MHRGIMVLMLTLAFYTFELIIGLINFVIVNNTAIYM